MDEVGAAEFGEELHKQRCMSPLLPLHGRGSETPAALARQSEDSGFTVSHVHGVSFTCIWSLCNIAIVEE